MLLLKKPYAVKNLIWIVASGVIALTSSFYCLAYIVHFEILKALGLFFLSAILWFIFVICIAHWEDAKNRKFEEMRKEFKEVPRNLRNRRN